MAGVSPSLPSFPVFVDNIHGDVQIKDLRGLFSRHGRVEEVTIVSSHGFVNFSCADEAVKAIERLHGYRFFGKKLSVELSKELSEFIDRRQRLARRRRSSEYSDHHLHRSRSRSRDHDQVNRRVAKKNHRHETTRKVRVEINESSIEKSPHDLREVLLQKKNKAIIEDDANMDTEETAADHNVQELYIGNLINAVEKVDLEQLLESYGPIKDVQIFPDHAIVTVQCSQEAANEAIETLDQNHWLDNDILVKFNQEPVAVKNPTTIVKTVINELASQQTGAGCDKTHELWIWSSILNEDTFLDDMTALVCQYGHIESKRWRLEASESISIELNCSEEKVIECIQDLNGRPYKSDSFIRIKFPDKCADESKLSSKIPNYPYQLMPTSIIPSKMPSNKSNNTKEKKIREIWIWSPAPNKKSFLEDMSSVVSQFGKVKSQCWLKNGQGAISIKLNSSEKQAVRCISETIGIQYKAHEIRIKFADGSLEDSLHKEPQYSIQLRRYPKQLIPDEFKKVERKSSTEAIIGVLPSSSSLGAFAVIPDKAAMTSIIRNARSSFDQEDDQQQPPRGEKNSLIGPPQLALNDAAFITSIEGTIHSVSNKLILISFRLASGRKVRMARLKPGHMFVDGKKSLGYLTKNKNFHEWPQAIKSWLQIGSSVMLDVQRLSEVEVEDMRDLTGESVMYETPLIWKQNSPRPLERLNLTATTVAMKATVIKLYPKWALLQPLQLNGGEKLILLQIKQFFVPEEDTKIQSLLSHIEVGDTLAVLAESSEYLLMAEIARGLPFFDERTDNLKYEAVLAWHLVSEVDPYAVELRKSRTEADDNGETTFMASSSTLCYPLPPEKEAQYRKWKGVIEELHIPSGGIIRLTEATASNWQEDRQRVYFHRSRLYVNGVRMSSNSALDEELVVGDIVTVDVAMNRFDMTSAYISGTEAFWIGLAVRVNTVDRGQCLANKLRAEGVDEATYASKVCQGRVVHFKRPEAGEAVTSGLAVIDSGPFVGQRIEFEAEHCYLFGYSLKRTDLSQIFQNNEPVCILVKPYNSYIIEKLWVGLDVKSNPGHQEGLMQLHKYLFDHSLDKVAFESLLRGQQPQRHFVPLEGQMYKGVVKGLKADTPDGPATRAVIEADVGEILFFEAFREDIFIFGHWMGKADLRYVLDKEEVCFEIHPVYAKDHHQHHNVPRASLVWLGGDGGRPNYLGQNTAPIINSQMDADLWKFVRSKQMDEKMFRALVEGRLPPKEKEATPKIVAEVEAPDGTRIKVDSEVLTQAALLQQMKTQFGSDALMKAMMLLVSQESGKKNAQSSAAKTDEASSTTTD